VGKAEDSKVCDVSERAGPIGEKLRWVDVDALFGRSGPESADEAVLRKRPC
jgi:hypothetical protein